ncbi:D,D-heptose 1,7-bisphosphate phosphatase [Breoghania corrubedonensis]|uniref:D,D-heptose 1,7-bisphosphate phosphatase n=1 Tax=Breoghania corrubedonensis TaxID=665038 RepID=A0A2T5UW36_9HYPH|nr:HAD-IIIA family hydrolase [Breoghania corrubedonensis]PTW55725.1 D,D-heptose 1,7-bisphosphate phosphatase [Breoghania corrubedonensis]
MQAIILAGGKGTRLAPLTLDRPKPLVEIAGKPMIAHQLELLARYGIRDVHILTGYLGHMFPETLGDGSRYGLEIRYHAEDRPLGTAGAVKAIASELADTFVVFYGDVVLDMQLDHFARVHRQGGAVGTLAVHPNDHPFDSDLVSFDQADRITAFHSKNRPADDRHENYVNAAAYCLSRDILDHISDEPEDFGLAVFPRIIAGGGHLQAYRTAEFIKDVGTLQRLRETEAKIVSGEVRSRNRENAQLVVFIDRDGVLIEEAGDALTAHDLALLPGVGEAVRLLQQAGYLVIMATNQPGIAKGFIDWDDVNAVHAEIDDRLARSGAFLTDKYVCPHHPHAGFPGERAELKVACDCRKPLPGLLLRARDHYNIDLERSFMVGDRSVDAAAAIAAGCTPLMVRTGFGGRDGICAVGDIPLFDDLPAAARHICALT